MIPTESYVEERIELILASPDFRSYVTEYFERFLRWLTEQIARLVGSLGGFKGIPIAVFITIITALLLVGLFFALRSWRMRKYKHTTLKPPADWVNSDAWAQCSLYAQRKEYEKAIIWLFLAYLKFLSELGLIKAHQSKTNFQYEMELVQNRYARLPLFRSFKNVFNAIRYGGKSADEGVYRYWREKLVELGVTI
ncbi:MAG: hypothetical protein FWG43_05845 [Clostridiales bacterium]|nr:hypothetical protein [Clostridiales bacterium]